MMEETFKTIQRHMKTRPVGGCDGCTLMTQQGFYFTPMDIAAHRVMKYGSQQAVVFVTHGSTPFNDVYDEY